MKPSSSTKSINPFTASSRRFFHFFVKYIFLSKPHCFVLNLVKWRRGLSEQVSIHPQMDLLVCLGSFRTTFLALWSKLDLSKNGQTGAIHSPGIWFHDHLSINHSNLISMMLLMLIFMKCTFLSGVKWNLLRR